MQLRGREHYLFSSARIRTAKATTLLGGFMVCILGGRDQGSPGAGTSAGQTHDRPGGRPTRGSTRSGIRALYSSMTYGVPIYPCKSCKLLKTLIVSTLTRKRSLVRIQSCLPLFSITYGRSSDWLQPVVQHVLNSKANRSRLPSTRNARVKPRQGPNMTGHKMLGSERVREPSPKAGPPAAVRFRKFQVQI